MTFQNKVYFLKGGLNCIENHNCENIGFDQNSVKTYKNNKLSDTACKFFSQFYYVQNMKEIYFNLSFL